MLNGRPAPTAIEYISPTSVVQRMSTQVIAVEDREVARVCRFIREHACDGIDVNDVAEFTTLSRRQLERRFDELDERLTRGTVVPRRQRIAERLDGDADHRNGERQESEQQAH